MYIAWQVKNFSALSALELYHILRLRLEVFSVEQNCAYQDVDGKDPNSFHLTAYEMSGMGPGKAVGGELIAYARVLPPGISFREVSIGRVVTSMKVRRTGVGRELMKRSLDFIAEKYGEVPVRIGAQCYLKKFYGEFGFVTDSVEYLEDNIPHVEMVRK